MSNVTLQAKKNSDRTKVEEVYSIRNSLQTTAFVPSSYTGKITSDAVGVTTAVADGASKLLLQSLEITGLEEYAVLAFGTSAANATANLNIAAAVGTTGIVIMSGDNTVGGAAPALEIGIPTNATHFSIVNGVSGLAQVIMVTQGR